MQEKILCVDDEANVLEAYRRALRKDFHIETALGAEPALAALDTQGPFAVVVSDLRMPEMDGIRLLGEIRRRHPDCVRIMLTGFADLHTTIDAVNTGNIFRFLTKPCPRDTLATALRAGVDQYRLVTAERQLLEQTLRGSIRVLADVLSLTNPAAFGHASRVRSLVHKLCEAMQVEKAWQIEIAAMLSQIGCVTVPPETLEKAQRGEKLTAEEAKMLNDHPAVGRDLVARIPRLDGVAEIIAYQQKRFDGSGVPADAIAGQAVPLGARILKLALDFDLLKASGRTDPDALVELRRRGGSQSPPSPERHGSPPTGWYDAEVLAALESVIGLDGALQVQEIALRDLATHMTLAEDVMTTGGTLVVSKGQEVTPSLCQRLRNFARNRGLKEPIRVYMNAPAVASHATIPAPPVPAGATAD